MTLHQSKPPHNPIGFVAWIEILLAYVKIFFLVIPFSEGKGYTLSKYLSLKFVCPSQLDSSMAKPIKIEHIIFTRKALGYW